MTDKIIYLDNASTTKAYLEVVKVMSEIMLKKYGNPSSAHVVGDEARRIIDDSRVSLAKEINAKPWEIIFTSGATESNNLALFGIAGGKLAKKRKKIIISPIEHSSIYETAGELKKRGFEILEIPVDSEGIIDMKYLENKIDENTLIVSIIHGNNEIGTLQDLEKIGSLCRKKEALFHTDAVQSFARETIDTQKMNIDLLSASGHKIGGPKGIGFLYVREGIRLSPVVFGGGQEKGIRAGTENVAAIAGFAKALEVTDKKDKLYTKKLRDYFISKLETAGGKINGSRDKRTVNNVHTCFECDSEILAAFLSQKGVMCSTRSACNEKSRKENRVLKAIGLKRKQIEGSLRFSIGFDTTKNDIDYACSIIKIFLKNSAKSN